MEHNKYSGFIYESISLEDMMSEREWRSEKSRNLVLQNKGTVICMTMNLIGEYKKLPLSTAAFKVFCKLINKTLNCSSFEMYSKPTGDVAFFITETSPEYTKAICEKIEDYASIGRLFDIDVFNYDGSKLSRTDKRKCLICNNDAAECSRSRKHGVCEVRNKILNILSDYYAQFISDFAKQALIDEVNTTPKPGLVDRNNSGANSDMNYDMFINSSEAIAPFFGKLFSIGAECTDISDKSFIESVKNIGLDAEKAMYLTTNNVNTHKGAIYSLGLISVGIGYALSGGGDLQSAIDAAADIALILSQNITDTNTHGIEVCKKYKVTGARGEAIGGFKTILYAFNRIKYYMDDRMLDTNNAYPLVLCDIMAVMTDTNVLHRGGQDALEFMRREAGEISQMRENQRIDDLKDLDEDFIKKNISPGGCADALACAIFLIKSEMLFIDKV